MAYIFLLGLFMLKINYVFSEKQTEEKMQKEMGQNIEQIQLASHLASEYRDLERNLETTKYILVHMDPLSVDLNGNTLAHAAVHFGFVEIIDNLKNQGISLDEINNLGYTPIGLAIVGGNYEMTKALLENGACVDTNRVHKIPFLRMERYSPMETLERNTKRIKSEILRDQHNIEQMRKDEQQLQQEIELARLEQKHQKRLESKLQLLRLDMIKKLKESHERQEGFLEARKTRDAISSLIHLRKWPICKRYY